MGKRRPLLRAGLELANAANGVRPFGRDGYPTVPCVLRRLADHRDGAAVHGRLDARRGVAVVARRLRDPRRPNLLAAQGDHLGAAVSHPSPQRGVGAVLRNAAAGHPRRRLRGRRRRVAADRAPTPEPCASERVPPSAVCGEDRHRHGTARTAAQLRRHLAPPRPTARRQSPGAAAGSRRRVVDRHAPSTGLSADESDGRTRMDLRVDRLPGEPRAHLAGPHRRRQARAGLGQGAHRRIRRRPRLRGDHRRLGGRASVRAGRADARRPAVSARFRGRRHIGGRGGSDLRPLRLVLHQGTRPLGVRSDLCCSGWSSRSG